jgi:hypothetical protein
MDQNKRLYSKKINKFSKLNYKYIDGKKIKVFDQKMKDYYENIPRKIIKECLGSYVIDNQNIYKEDMIILNDYLKIKFIEIQVFGKWKNLFPYEKPFIFSRKLKLDENTLFICFNSDYTKIIMFEKNDLSHKTTHPIYNEDIINVEWKDIYELSIEELNMQFLEQYFKKN